MSYRFRLCALALLGPLVAGTVQAEEFERGNVQVFLGSFELDDQRGNWSDVSTSGVDVDFSALPVLGMETEYLLHKGWLHIGINPGGSLALNNEDMRISGTRLGQSGELALAVDNTLGLAEIHLGAFVRGRMHERITAYAAAGPMFLYAKFEVESVTVDGAASTWDIGDNSSSDFNLGYYARAGIDFEFQSDRHFGLGVRYLSAELDFEDTVGNVDIEGPQWLFSYTQRW